MALICAVQSDENSLPQEEVQLFEKAEGPSWILSPLPFLFKTLYCHSIVQSTIAPQPPSARALQHRSLSDTKDGGSALRQHNIIFRPSSFPLSSASRRTTY